MEIPIIGGIALLGYFLKSNNNKKKSKKQPSNTQQKNIYKNNRYDQVNQEVTNTKAAFFEKSKDPINENVIPEQMNQDILNKNHNSIAYLQNKENGLQNKNKSEKVYSSLTGKTVLKEHFVHNNMVPFFGSKVTQNMSETASQGILERHTGIERFKIKKQETKPFFKPTANLGNVYGQQAQTDRELERFVPSQKKTMEMPFEQIQVGPGLNKGYTGEASGGFHQANTRDYIMPKSIDELRTLNNPKLSYKGKVLAGKNISQRGKIGKSFKHRPDTFYINSSDRFLTTTGAQIKEKKRPCILLKDTNRKDTTVQYHGPAKASSDKSGDYGKEGINLPATEREITGTRTHVSNVASVVKAIIAPVMDVMKTTKKENCEGNIRQSGNFAVSVNKLKVHDPNDVARTTLKEAYIHDNRLPNFGSYKKAIIYDPDDVAKTTIRETTEDKTRTGNFGTEHDKHIVYDPSDKAKTTTKEMTIYDDHKGIVSRGQTDGYKVSSAFAPNTNKQFTSDHEYTGIAQTVEMTAPTSHDNIENARLNEVREGTLKLRDPTKCNVSLKVGADAINVDIKKLDSDRVNTRNLAKTKVFNSIPQAEQCYVTTHKDQLNNKPLAERIDPVMVKAFKENPFTKSLSSYQYGPKN